MNPGEFNGWSPGVAQTEQSPEASSGGFQSTVFGAKGISNYVIDGDKSQY